MTFQEVDDTNLASSSLTKNGEKSDILGILIAYFVKVIIMCIYNFNFIWLQSSKEMLTWFFLKCIFKHSLVC